MKLILFIFLFSIIINSDFKNVQVLNIESKKEMKKYMKKARTEPSNSNFKIPIFD